MYGIGTDAGVQGEIGRVDYTGKEADFDDSYLYGFRNKATPGSLPLPYGFGISASASWYLQKNGEYVIGASVNLGWWLNGIGAFGFGFNFGEIKK